MTFKFLPRALALKILVLLAFGAAVSRAQNAPPSSSPARKPPGGFVRLLNLEVNGDTTYILSASADPAAKPLTTASPGNFFATYAHVLPGRYSLRVAKMNAPDQTLKALDATVPDKGYFTVLVWPDPAGKPVIDLLDETPDPKKESNRLAVRQLYPNSRAVVTTAGQRTAPLEYGQAQTLDNMPDGRAVVLARVITPKGAHSWSSEADFTQSRHASAYVVADPYGRIRLRYTADGPDPKTEKEDREAAAAAPSAPQ